MRNGPSTISYRRAVCELAVVSRAAWHQPRHYLPTPVSTPPSRRSRRVCERHDVRSHCEAPSVRHRLVRHPMRPWLT